MFSANFRETGFMGNDDDDASLRWFRQHAAACLREREVQDYTALFSICVWHCVGLILLLAAIAGEGTTE